MFGVHPWVRMCACVCVCVCVCVSHRNTYTLEAGQQTGKGKSQTGKGKSQTGKGKSQTKRGRGACVCVCVCVCDTFRLPQHVHFVLAAGGGPPSPRKRRRQCACVCCDCACVVTVRDTLATPTARQHPSREPRVDEVVLKHSLEHTLPHASWVALVMLLLKYGMQMSGPLLTAILQNEPRHAQAVVTALLAGKNKDILDINMKIVDPVVANKLFDPLRTLVPRGEGRFTYRDDVFSELVRYTLPGLASDGSEGSWSVIGLRTSPSDCGPGSTRVAHATWQAPGESSLHVDFVFTDASTQQYSCTPWSNLHGV